MLATLHPSWADFVLFSRSCDLLFEVAAELPAELVSPWSDGEVLEVQSLKQKTDFYFFFSHYLPPQPQHFCSEMKPSQKPRNWEKHRSHFTQSGWQSSYLLHQCKQERCLHNCMEKWEEPASLGSCVWKNEAPSALLEKKKIWGVENSRSRARIQGEKNTEEEKKAALK